LSAEPAANLRIATQNAPYRPGTLGPDDAGSGRTSSTIFTGEDNPVRRGRDPALCSEQDHEGAQALAVEVDRLREDCVAMLAVAAERGVLVPDDLRERLSLGARGLPATRSLHAELAAIVRPAL
jgi:hypothetical protein